MPAAVRESENSLPLNLNLKDFQTARTREAFARVAKKVIIRGHALLQESLSELGALPERQGQAVASVLAKYDRAVNRGEAFTMDVAERPVERSQDDDNRAANRQQDHYSGKQKDHTVKNNRPATRLMCRDNQQIVYLSETYEGRVHDKKIADQEACLFPPNSRLRLDLAYLGYHPEGVITLLPVKKPYKGKLTEQDKKFNRWVSRYRVVVEHAISGLERCRIVKERCLADRAATLRLASVIRSCSLVPGCITSESTAHTEAMVRRLHARAHDTTIYFLVRSTLWVFF